MKTETITRAELEQLYNSMPVRDAIEKLGVTMHTFYKALNAANIPRKVSPYKERVLLKVI